MSALKNLKDLVQDAVDKGARTVEEVHVAIANQPLEILERIVPAAPAMKTLGEIQKRSIGVVYDMIRTVNKAVGDIAEELLDKVEKGDKPDKPGAPSDKNS